MAQALPVKNAEQQWAVWDSTRLNNFPFRDDDIIIGTWSKSGTTWTQQLVAQLVFRGGIPKPTARCCRPGRSFALHLSKPPMSRPKRRPIAASSRPTPPSIACLTTNPSSTCL